MRASTLVAGLSHYLPVRQGIHGVGDTPEILSRIYEDPIKLCILQRALDADLKYYVGYLRQNHVGFELTRIINVAQIRDYLDAVLPRHSAQNVFIEDVSWLVEMFTCLFDLENVGLRLKVLATTMCPRFHTDKVPCRLITTYAGKGTEWLDGKLIDRAKLAAGNAYQEVAGNYGGQSLINSLQEGEIALFKGDRWGEQHESGVIHRSPPLDFGETRLLLTLDFA